MSHLASKNKYLYLSVLFEIKNLVEQVQRFDVARISNKVVMTSQGFLRAPGAFTRAGVFEYRRADGSLVRELRDESEVFRQDSLSTLSNAPVTRDHPSEGMVSPENAKRLSIGYAAESLRRDGNLVVGKVTIIDKEAIEDIKSKRLKEFSCGYKCTVDKTPGVHPIFGRYDQAQKNIIYNHLAIGGQDWGRAGNDVSIRLDNGGAIMQEDSESAFVFDEVTEAIDIVNPAIRGDKKDEQMKTKTLTINGVDFELELSAAQAVEAEFNRKDSALEGAVKTQDGLQGRFDAQVQEIKNLKQQLEQANDSERFDAAVAARIDLASKAREVLGDKADIKGSARDIMETVLKKDSKDLDFSSRSDDYVEARFDAFIENFKDSKNSNRFRTRIDARNASESVNRSEEARKRMIERHQNAWKSQPAN